MTRTGRVLLRVAVISIVAAPWMGVLPVAPSVAHADALPGDPDDVYYHCTAAEQCPTGSEICPATIGPAGQRPVEAKCAEAATAKKLERRCWGRDGHLFCPPGATGSWKGKDSTTKSSPTPPSSTAPSSTSTPPPVPASSQPKRGC